MLLPASKREYVCLRFAVASGSGRELPRVTPHCALKALDLALALSSFKKKLFLVPAFPECLWLSDPSWRNSHREEQIIYLSKPISLPLHHTCSRLELIL